MSRLFKEKVADESRLLTELVLTGGYGTLFVLCYNSGAVRRSVSNYNWFDRKFYLRSSEHHPVRRSEVMRKSKQHVFPRMEGASWL